MFKILKKSNLYLLFLLATFTSCVTDSQQNSTYSVSGKISSSTTSVADVAVSIDGGTTLTATSDANGNFIIKNVPIGSHNLKIYKQTTSTTKTNKVAKTLADDSFSEKNYSITVNSDLVLNSLILPKPVLLRVSENTSSTTTINWDSSDDAGFREYKLYRHTSPGLDESTGELIYISTSANVTNFIDTKLNSNTDYYYRVYTMNDLGRLGGSNIINIKTSIANLALNGSFESSNIDASALNWTYRNNFKDYAKVVVDNSSPDGTHCLSINIPVYHASLSFGDLYQLVSGSEIQQGIKYKLSVWVKVIDLSGFADCSIELYNNKGYVAEQRITINSSATRNIWKEYTTEFYGGSPISSYTLQLISVGTIPYNNEPYKILIDKISLQKM